MTQETKKKREKKDMPVSVNVFEVYLWMCPECLGDNHMYGYVPGDVERCRLCEQEVLLV